MAIAAMDNQKTDQRASPDSRTTDDEASMWEIAETLHRADLSALERDVRIAEQADAIRKGVPVAGARKALGDYPGRGGAPADLARDAKQVARPHIKKARQFCLTSLGLMLSTVPVHPWSKES